MYNAIAIIAYALCIGTGIAQSNNQALTPIPAIDFDLSMGPKPIQFGLIDIDDREWFSFFRSLYIRYSAVMPDYMPRIPPIIHQIWLGDPKAKEAYQLWMKSWRLFHPTWLYFLWTDEDVEHLSLVNRELYNRSNNYGQRSDIVRYELLYTFGGLYVDVDMRCLKAFDTLHHCYDFYIGILHGGCAELAIGLIGSVPGHPILKEVIMSMSEASSIDPEKVLETTGNYHFLHSFMRAAPPLSDTRIITFPCSFFYPSPNSERFLTYAQQDAWIKPESYAIHYWTCSWQKESAIVRESEQEKE